MHKLFFLQFDTRGKQVVYKIRLMINCFLKFECDVNVQTKKFSMKFEK